MPGNLKLQTGTHTGCQDGTSSALANGAAAAAATATIANQTNLDRAASFVLNTGFTVAPAAGAEIQLYLVPKLDGANFADADVGTPYLNPNHYAGSFFVEKSQTGAQRLTLEGVTLGPFEYKAHLSNKSLQQQAAGWTLDAYGEQGQYT
jgi:hypothetical protein